MNERPTEQQIADSLLRGLEHLFGDRGIWKDKLTWDYQRQASRKSSACSRSA